MPSNPFTPMITAIKDWVLEKISDIPTGSTTLVDLTDTSISSPTNSQVLKYNSSTSKWENADESGGGGIEQIQSDWNQTNTTAKDYIKNKPKPQIIDSILSGTSTNPVENAIITKTLNNVIDKIVGKALEKKSGIKPEKVLNNYLEYTYRTDIRTSFNPTYRCIWTDGDNIYYSSGSTHYVLDKSANTWNTKTWNGLTNFVGSNIWSDGDNIYYSNGSNHYVLDKSANTWNTKTWNGLTNFVGSNIWSDGDNIYYDQRNLPYSSVLDKTTDTWVDITWNLTIYYPEYIWTDGDNIYYSNGSSYVLDKESEYTWLITSWGGLNSIDGRFIWTDGDNIYYSSGSGQYVLDKEAAYWNSKTWRGLSDIDGRYIWTDGTNVYYNGDLLYILDKSSDLWIPANMYLLEGLESIKEYIWTYGGRLYYSSGSYKKYYIYNILSQAWDAVSWDGYDYLNGNYIWTDGDNIYYSSGSTHYVLDKSANTWNTKTWNGLSSFYGDYIWSDGDNIYYSYGSTQYILNKSTSTWNTKTWNGLSSFDGKYIWTDGDNIYYSSGSDHYVLDKSTSTWSQKTWYGLSYLYAENIWTDGDDIYYSYGSDQYVLNKSTSTWSQKTWTGDITEFYGNSIWSDGIFMYITTNDANHPTYIISR